MGTLHEDITRKMQTIVDRQLSVRIITPDSLADAVMGEFFDPSKLEPHNHYLSREQAKQMSRRFLASRFEPDEDESEAYQGELFSGRLQKRYPQRHRAGETPGYILLEFASDEDLEWNEDKLRKSANARQEHADALRAYRLRRLAAA